MPEITLDGLGKHFGPVTAVENLNLHIKPGSVTAFLGPNGAGKTTTLRMVLGLVRPTAGRALIGGRPYADLPPHAGPSAPSLARTAFTPGVAAATTSG